MAQEAKRMDPPALRVVMMMMVSMMMVLMMVMIDRMSVRRHRTESEVWGVQCGVY